MLVYPFEKIIGAIFLRLLGFINNHGITLMILSFVVNIVLLPFYHFADRIEKRENDIQQAMKPKIDEFKSVYKGYELHLYIKNVYRLHGYRPVYALRGLISLLVQIPFFLGAYSFLSQYSGFAGVNFLSLTDLAKPDALFVVGRFSINILPLLMTFFNLASGYLYGRNNDMNYSGKVTIVVVALFFLAILYNSPSSLLIYWTCNNLFSLLRNLILTGQQKKMKHLEGV